jgi:chromate transport protein ChrA
MHALSIPTWMVHIGSVTEWIVAIALAWIYADVSQNRSWRWLSLAMLPALASAIVVCTWHWFDNDPSLQWLSLVQATMTFIGNCTLMLAGWWLWKQSLRPQ